MRLHPGVSLMASLQAFTVLTACSGHQSSTIVAFEIDTPVCPRPDCYRAAALSNGMLSYSPLPKDYASTSRPISSNEALSYLREVPAEAISRLASHPNGFRNEPPLKLFVKYTNAQVVEVTLPQAADEIRGSDNKSSVVRSWAYAATERIASSVTEYRNQQLLQAFSKGSLQSAALTTSLCSDAKTIPSCKKLLQMRIDRAGEAVRQGNQYCSSVRFGHIPFAQVVRVLEQAGVEAFPPAYPGYPYIGPQAVIGLEVKGNLYATWGALNDGSSPRFRQAVQRLTDLASKADWVKHPAPVPTILRGPPCERGTV